MNDTANTRALHGVGRRKSSVSRVWLKAGNGTITVNGRTFDEYFCTEIARHTVRRPFLVSNLAGKFDVTINTSGGGQKAQAAASSIGISRALLELDASLRPALKKGKLLTVDSRVKERKKPGQKAARAKFQFVKR